MLQQAVGAEAASSLGYWCMMERMDRGMTESKIQASKTMQLLKTGSAYPKYPSARDWEPVFQFHMLDQRSSTKLLSKSTLKVKKKL